MGPPVHTSCLQLGSPVGLAVGSLGTDSLRRGEWGKVGTRNGEGNSSEPTTDTPQGQDRVLGLSCSPGRRVVVGAAGPCLHTPHITAPPSPIPEEQTATAVAKEARRLFQGLLTAAEKKAEMSHIAMAQDSRASRREAGV